MTLLDNLSECLAFVRRFVPPFDEAALEPPVELPAGADWDALLNALPAALALRSPLLAGAAWSLTTDFGGWDQTRGYGFGELLRVRRQLVSPVSDTDREAAARELTRPRALLVFNPAVSLFDGAGHVASKGFLDRNYVPPWDTWLMTLPPLPPEFGRGAGPLVVSWVPTWAAELVAGGIAVDPASCLSWGALEGDTVRVAGWGVHAW